jgi:flagellar motor switch protein FliM
VGDLELLFSELLSLKKNQVIKFDYFDRAKISVGGKLLFLGEVGQIEDNIAVKLIGSAKD